MPMSGGNATGSSDEQICFESKDSKEEYLKGYIRAIEQMTGRTGLTKEDVEIFTGEKLITDDDDDKIP